VYFILSKRIEGAKVTIDIHYSARELTFILSFNWNTQTSFQQKKLTFTITKQLYRLALKQGLNLGKKQKQN